MGCSGRSTQWHLGRLHGSVRATGSAAGSESGLGIVEVSIDLDNLLYGPEYYNDGNTGVARSAEAGVLEACSGGCSGADCGSLGRPLVGFSCFGQTISPHGDRDTTADWCDALDCWLI